MGREKYLTKTPYLILFIILGAIGISAVSAVTITLSGTTIVDGTITADDYFDSKNVQTGENATAIGGFENIANALLSTIGGGSFNTASHSYSTIAGGSNNTSSGYGSEIGGGSNNTASGAFSAVGGGFGNTASGNYAIVGGGFNNNASALLATVAGGGGYTSTNTASSTGATVGGGSRNTASGIESTVGGGNLNLANGYRSTVPGGYNNLASGDYSFAAGQKAKAIHDGSFVWADTTNAFFESTAADQFAIRASGGVLIQGDVICTDCIDSADVDTSQIQSRVTGTCPSGEFMEQISEDGSVSCGGLGTSSLSVGSESTTSIYNGGNDYMYLGSTTNRLCYLTFVQLRDVDSAGEDAWCSITIDSGQWLLTAHSEIGDDSDAICKARCLTW